MELSRNSALRLKVNIMQVCLVEPKEKRQQTPFLPQTFHDGPGSPLKFVVQKA